jgi:hypothetical protein
MLMLSGLASRPVSLPSNPFNKRSSRLAAPFVDPPGLPDEHSQCSCYRDWLLAQFPFPQTPSTKEAAVWLLLLLTHLGSNQDSAEPKSVVLPITPWVNQTSKGAAKLEKKINSYTPYGILILIPYIIRNTIYPHIKIAKLAVRNT